MWNEKILLPKHNPRKNIFDNVDSIYSYFLVIFLPGCQLWCVTYYRELSWEGQPLVDNLNLFLTK